MGCLIELFLEIVVEVLFELIAVSYIKLMQLIVPNKSFTKRKKKIIKNTVTTIFSLLGVVLIIGVVFLVQDDTLFKTIGAYMTYIPLAIITFTNSFRNFCVGFQPFEKIELFCIRRLHYVSILCL